MKSHELAKILLELPDIPVVDFENFEEVRTVEAVNASYWVQGNEKEPSKIIVLRP